MLLFALIFAAEQLHGWDLLITKFFDNLPSIVTLLGSTGFLAWWNARKVNQAKVEVRADIKDNTDLTVAKNEETKQKIDSTVKDNKANAETVTAAAIIAKQNAVKVAVQHEAVNAKLDEQTEKLDKVVKELNGGFDEKVMKAIQPHVEETSRRFDLLEAHVGEIRHMLTVICPECPKTEPLRIKKTPPKQS